MNSKIVYYAELERLLRETLGVVGGNFPEEDRAEVEMFIDFAEYGLAYESVISLLGERKISYPESLTIAGKMMGLCS